MNIKLFVILLIFTLPMASCQWESEDTSALYDLFYLERNGAQMPVHIHGNVDSKVFIILLHGGPGGNGLQYRAGVFSEVIEKNYAVAYFDQRGQGMSQGRLDMTNTNVNEMVEDVHALAGTIKFKYGSDNSIFLLGHSWGGTLGSALMTTDYQHDFNGWIEVDGAHDFDLMVKAQRRLISTIGSQEVQMDRDTEFWTEFIEIAEEVDSVNYTEEDVISLNNMSFTAEEKLTEAEIIRDGLGDYLNLGVFLKSNLLITNPLTSMLTGSQTNSSLTENEGLFSSDFSLDLSKIEIPTLLLWGKFDFVVPAELGYQALEEISSPHKSLIIYEESGHSPMINEGIPFGEDLIDFVEEFK